MVQDDLDDRSVVTHLTAVNRRKLPGFVPFIAVKRRKLPGFVNVA